MRHILILGWNVLRVFRALALYNITLKSLSSTRTEEEPQTENQEIENYIHFWQIGLLVSDQVYHILPFSNSTKMNLALLGALFLQCAAIAYLYNRNELFDRKNLIFIGPFVVVLLISYLLSLTNL